MTDPANRIVAPTTAPEGSAAAGAADGFAAAVAPPPAAPSEGLGWLEGFQAPLAAVFDTGGPVVAILAGFSIVALAIVLLKLWQFTRLHLGNQRPVEEALALWYRHDPRAAIAAVARRRQPVARVVHLAMTGLQRPGVEPATLREELVRVALAQLEQLRSYLRALEVIGTLSPLLGLLGTVLGMIEAFRQLEAVGARVDPGVLSGGIWEALLTTAVGLAVAIPVIVVHSWLERRVERCSHQMEDAVTRVFTRGLKPQAGPCGGGREPPVPSAEVGYAA